MSSSTVKKSSARTGYLTGGVANLARLEGLAIFVFALMAYDFLNFKMSFFILFFFVPDLALLAYFASSRVGCVAYNATHSYILPLCLCALGFYFDSSDIYKVAIVWVARIGADRAFGFGLKYERGFRYTHLGKIGEVEDETNNH